MRGLGPHAESRPALRRLPAGWATASAHLRSRGQARRARGSEDISTIVALDDRRRRFGRSGAGEGYEFYASPCAFRPDGRKLWWLSRWNHPTCRGTPPSCGWLVQRRRQLASRVHIAGGPGEWSSNPSGDPTAVASSPPIERILEPLSGSRRQVEPVRLSDADFAVPQWLFSLSTYAFFSHDVILCTFTERGEWRLATLDPRAANFAHLRTFTWFSGLRAKGSQACRLSRAHRPNRRPSS